MVQGRVVPSLNDVDVHTPAFAFFLKAAHGFGDAGFGGLEFHRHRNAVAIIPYGDGQRYLHDGSGVDGFPEDAFRGAGIANGAEADLLALVGEGRLVGQLFVIPVFAGGLGQPEGAAHLSGGAGNVGRNIIEVLMFGPVALFVDQLGGEVVVHLPAAGERVIFGIGIELREEFLDGGEAHCQHHRLVAVIAGPPVTFAENLGKDYLGQFLAIAGNAEFGLPGKHLLSGQQAGLPADATDLEVLQNGFPLNIGAARGRKRCFVGNGVF